MMKKIRDKSRYHVPKSEMAKKKPLLILQKLKGSQWNIMNNFKPTNQRTNIKKKKILERYNYQN